MVGLKGGHPQKNPFKFCSAGICNNANNLPECQKAAFLTFRKFIFSGGSSPLDPPLYYATRRQFYPTNMQKSIKHTKWKVSKQKITNSVGHFSFFLWEGGGGGHLNLFAIQGGGGLLPKIPYEEGGHHILQELPFKSPSPPPA